MFTAQLQIRILKALSRCGAPLLPYLSFLYRHSAELLLNLRSDPATCYLRPSHPDLVLHDSPCGQRFYKESTRATDSWREIHKACLRPEEKKKSVPVLTHLLKTEWSAKFVWEGFWQCPAALSVQHMLQALASPIAFQVIGQAQQEVGFYPHDTSLIHSWIRNKVS